MDLAQQAMLVPTVGEGETDHLDPEEMPQPEDIAAVEAGGAGGGRRPRPATQAGAAPEPAARERGRFRRFLRAVWAELQRVHWPDRKAVGQATAVVLGFVLIAGGYLGLLDTIFSRLVEAII